MPWQKWLPSFSGGGAASFLILQRIYTFLQDKKPALVAGFQA